MSKAKDLIKNTFILTAAKISTQAVSFLLLPLYTSLLTTDEYGRVDIYTSLAMIILPVLTLQIEMALFRYFITSETELEKKEIISSSFAAAAAVVLFGVLAFVVFTTFVPLPNSEFLILCFYLSQVVSTLLLQLCRAEGDNAGYGIAAFLISALAVGFNVIFITVFKWGVEGILLSTVLAQLISSLYLVYRTKVKDYISLAMIKIARCKELLNYSVPLIFNQIASWAINYSDRILILVFFGEGTNGIYSVANKFSNITNTFFNVYNVAWTENVIRSMKDENSSQYISRVFEITFSIYIIIVTGIINFIPFAFNFFVGNTFKEAYHHIPILLTAMLFSGMAATIGSIYVAYKKTKDVSVTTILAGICNIAVHWLMISEFKLFAASISTLVSFALLFIYRMVFLKKFFVLKADYRKIIIQIIILIISWYGYSAQNTVIQAVGLSLNIAYIIWFIKKHYSMLLNIIKRKSAE